MNQVFFHSSGIRAGNGGHQACGLWRWPYPGCLGQGSSPWLGSERSGSVRPSNRGHRKQTKAEVNSSPLYLAMPISWNLTQRFSISHLACQFTVSCNENYEIEIFSGWIQASSFVYYLIMIKCFSHFLVIFVNFQNSKAYCILPIC